MLFMRWLLFTVVETGCIRKKVDLEFLYFALIEIKKMCMWNFFKKIVIAQPDRKTLQKLPPFPPFIKKLNVKQMFKKNQNAPFPSRICALFLPGWGNYHYCFSVIIDITGIVQSGKLTLQGK